MRDERRERLRGASELVFLCSGNMVRSAFAELDLPPERLVEQSGLDPERVDEERLRTALAGLRARMGVRRDRLLDDWAGVDAALARWVTLRSETLEALHPGWLLPRCLLN